MKTGHADMPLHYGKVPMWLYSRMNMLGGAIVEAIVLNYGRSALLEKISDPFWFQALGCVLGMDWHSSGITTSVMGALKKAVNERSSELGIYICGGRGSNSLKTPSELLKVAEKTGLDGNELVRCSRLAAKVDNNAIQDGFQLYLHSFMVTREGEWAIIQQGMNTNSRMARRYHWHSPKVKSFLETPHSSIYGENQGMILNLTDKNAGKTKNGILALTRENPFKLMTEIVHLHMPFHHDVRKEDVNLKRLGTTLAIAHDTNIRSMEPLLLLQGVGPRTIQSLTLVSEIIHGTPSRFSDPARFSFAHGGKDGHPFPVPTRVYDECIELLENAIAKSKLGQTDKMQSIKNLSILQQKLEKGFKENDRFSDLIEKERKESYQYGGMTVKGASRKPGQGTQLSLFN